MIEVLAYGFKLYKDILRVHCRKEEESVKDNERPAFQGLEL